MNVDPSQIQFYIPVDFVLKHYGHPRLLRGLEVVNNEILSHKLPVLDEYKIKYCFKRWVEGFCWHELPIEPAEPDRYLKLDAIYQEAKETGELRNNPGDNVLIHMINGEPYFAGGGYHRLAISLILGLKEIPVDISLICTAKGGECETEKASG